MRQPSDIRELLPLVERFRTHIKDVRERVAPKEFWYPYGSLDNFGVLERLLTGPNRDLLALAGGLPIADIGAADGDVAFFLETLGCTVEIVDNGATNWNGLRGAQKLKEALESSVEIHTVDLDEQFRLPRERYGLVFFLGLLYHLQNPFYALQRLSRSARHALISTRIARMTTDRRVELDRIPVGYLVGPSECNNDRTNYWIFSDAGLRRLFERTGWEVVDYLRVGDTFASNPSQPDHDERAFVLVRSLAPLG